MIATINNRIAEVLTKDAPFKTVEEYTEWWLTKTNNLDLTQEAVALQKSWNEYHITEVSLDRLANKAVDMMAVVIDDLDANNLWDKYTDYDQFLVIGTVQEVGNNHYYRQGNGDDLEGKFQREQDAWLDSLD